MNLKELLQEELQELKAVLQHDCAPFLKEAGNGLLLRGIQDPGPERKATIGGETIPYFKKTVRQNRRPLDTAKDIHKIVDDYFWNQFGMRGRSAAMFAYGEKVSPDMFEQYGDAYIVFPIGRFDYIWSPHVSDMSESIADDIDIDKFEDEDDYDGLEEEVEDWLDQMDYNDSNLDKALKSNSEIMIKCDSYYAIPYEFFKQVKGIL